MGTNSYILSHFQDMRAEELVANAERARLAEVARSMRRSHGIAAIRLHLHHRGKAAATPTPHGV